MCTHVRRMLCATRTHSSTCVWVWVPDLQNEEHAIYNVTSTVWDHAMPYHSNNIGRFLSRLLPLSFLPQSKQIRKEQQPIRFDSIQAFVTFWHSNKVKICIWNAINDPPSEFRYVATFAIAIGESCHLPYWNFEKISVIVCRRQHFEINCCTILCQ